MRDKTVKYIKKILGETSFLLVRGNPFDHNPGDIDVLVNSEDFSEVIHKFRNAGFKISSHDQALGGRIKGMQVNINKIGFLKIDLHKDFTWRKWRYLDLDFVWNGSKNNNPTKAVDTFLILINVLFEKTYLEKFDYEYLQKNKNLLGTNVYSKQAKKYGWEDSFKKLLKWLDNHENIEISSTLFLPVTLVLSATFEKFFYEKKIDLTSLFYYFFFRIRYLTIKKLPYS